MVFHPKPDSPYRRADDASQGERATEGRRCARAERRKRLVQPWAVPAPQLNAPSRKVLEREMDDPEGNLVIVERVGHESQRRFPYWEYGWVGTAHSTEQHCIRYETHADACAPFGFGFAESTLRFASAHFPAFSADSQALNTAHLENRLFQLPKGENQCLSLYLSGANAFCHSKNG